MRMINTRFWDDDYTANLDQIEKLMFLYFLTNPATEICGIYELPLKNIATDTGIEKDMVENILKRFKRDKKVFYLNGWVAVTNFIFHQNLNPSVVKGIENGLEQAPKPILDMLGTDWLERVRACLQGFGNRNRNETKLNEIESNTELFDFWNSKKIIEHRKLTPEIGNEITKSLKNYSLEEIKFAIETYATVLEKGVEDSKRLYWWSHSWTLFEFLKRGMKQFEGKTPDDYKKKTTTFAKGFVPEVDRFDLSKK